VICRVSHILSHSMQIILCWLWSMFVQHVSLYIHYYPWLLRGECDQDMLHARLESALSILSTSMLLRETHLCWGVWADGRSEPLSPASDDLRIKHRENSAHLTLEPPTPLRTQTLSVKNHLQCWKVSFFECSLNKTPYDFKW